MATKTELEAQIAALRSELEALRAYVYRLPSAPLYVYPTTPSSPYIYPTTFPTTITCTTGGLGAPRVAEGIR